MKAIGYPQNPSDISKLYDIANLFVTGSAANTSTIANIRWLSNQQLDYRGAYYDATDPNLSSYISYLTSPSNIPYNVLKGKGACGRPSRSAAACSGLIQAVLNGQKNIKYKDKLSGAITNCKKPYTDDWTADGFLRWAISIGILNYDENTDSCSLSALGAKIASCTGSTDPNFNVLLGTAFLSYPPVCRILDLLNSTFGIAPGSTNDPKLTKFKLGSQLGFYGEDGFTSIAENIWLAEYNLATTPAEKSDIRSNREGTMDKHARMICSWLSQIGWVITSTQTVTDSFGGISYSAYMECYYITLSGHNALAKSLGISSHHRIPKNVYLGTLATKSTDADYLSTKRAIIIDCISGSKTAKDLASIQSILLSKNFSETLSTIQDDIDGLERIGISISKNTSGQFHVDDIITNLVLPTITAVTPSTITGVINSLRSSISFIDHKYLNLINYSIDPSKNRDLEQLTLDLLTNELGFNGMWLGGASKPDGIISENTEGLIIDTKAYSGGYNLPRAQKDEMFRYICDFVYKNPTVNPTKWWTHFPTAVLSVKFSFVSSDFTSTVPTGLSDISNRTIPINGGNKINGGAITTKVLLEKAENVKNGSLSKSDFLKLFDYNTIVA